MSLDIFPLVYGLVAGYYVRDIMQIYRDHKETIRRIDAAHEANMERFRAMVNEAYEDGGDSLWRGFCPKCRGVHGTGECAGKWWEANQ